MRESGSASEQTVTFRIFWEFIAQQLGDAWLTLNPSAHKVSELVSLSYDPKEYLKQVIVQSYKRSACKNLDSPINLAEVLDVLGETAYSLQGERRDDLFDIELLEEIAWHISDRYAEQLAPDSAQPELGSEQLEPATRQLKPTIASHASAPKSAAVISFPDYRIRRANTLL